MLTKPHIGHNAFDWLKTNGQQMENSRGYFLYTQFAFA
jgi:hypothetical protein